MIFVFEVLWIIFFLVLSIVSRALSSLVNVAALSIHVTTIGSFITISHFRERLFGLVFAVQIIREALLMHEIVAAAAAQDAIQGLTIGLLSFQMSLSFYGLLYSLK